MNTQSPKVSIIIPVFNAEKYLRDCLDSLICQTLEQIEIICVDDGSFDSSPLILREYAAADPRIHVFSQVKQNAGAARNHGMDQARGEYLLFLDADDFFAPELAEVSYQKAKEKNADICIFKADGFDDQTGKKYSLSWALINEYCPSECFSPLENSQYLFQFTGPFLWHKLFRKEFLDRKGIRFQSIQRSNDVAFVLSALAYADKIVISDRVLTIYRRNNPQSLAGAKQTEILAFYEALLELKSRIETHPHFGEIRESFIHYAAIDMFSHFKFYKIWEPGMWDSFQTIWDHCREHAFHDFGFEGIEPEFFDLVYRPEDRFSEKFKTFRDGSIYDFALKFNYQKITKEQWLFITTLYQILQKNHTMISYEPGSDIDRFLNDPYEYYVSTCKKYAYRPEHFDLIPARILQKAAIKDPSVSVVYICHKDGPITGKVIESILGQTYKDLEVICVPECNENDSLSCMLRFAETDPRVTVISGTGPNYGYPENIGIEHANGKYLLILNGDDILSPDCIAGLVSYAEGSQTDMSLSRSFPDGKPGKMFETDEYIFPNKMSEPISGKAFFTILWNGNRFSFNVWIILIRSDFLKEYNIRFREGMQYAETLFLFDCLKTANRVNYTDTACSVKYDSPMSNTDETDLFYIIYGLLQCIAESRAALTGSNDHHFNRAASSWFSQMAEDLRGYYHMYPDKNHLRSKLSSDEYDLLNQLAVLQETERSKHNKEIDKLTLKIDKLSQKIDKLSEERETLLEAITLLYSSRSYRLGNLLISPLHFLKKAAGKQ